MGSNTTQNCRGVSTVNWTTRTTSCVGMKEEEEGRKRGREGRREGEREGGEGREEGEGTGNGGMDERKN